MARPAAAPPSPSTSNDAATIPSRRSRRAGCLDVDDSATTLRTRSLSMPEPSRSTADEVDDGRPEGRGSVPGHLVITVHGIRTYGNWQAELNSLLKQAEPGITVLNYQ